MGRRASVRVEFSRSREMRSVADLALPTVVVDLIHLAIRFFPFVRPFCSDSCRGALEATLSTRNEPVTTLETRVAWNNTEKAAKKMRLSNLDWRVRTAEGGVSLMSRTICELKSIFAEADRLVLRL